MKTVYLIGGTMGVGKTAVGNILKEELPNAVFLDGDNCWNASPFIVTEETKAMVLDNICYLLNNFIHCTAYENIIFCWVLDRQQIIDTILSRIDTKDCEIRSISLVCSEEALRQRLLQDIEAGKRNKDIIARSLERLPLFESLNTFKIDVSFCIAEEAAQMIAMQVGKLNNW